MRWYEELVEQVIRPPRAAYDESADLKGGHSGEFELQGRRYRRDDFEVENQMGQKLKCSHYVPASFNPDSTTSQSLPCVVYAHGNCGCRLEALDAVYCLLPANITVCALDFSGSGLSGGEYVTLGKTEASDLEAVCDYLREKRAVDRLGLWGRSMGAVASIFFSVKNPIVSGMFLDSAFSNLVTLMLELVDEFAPKLPKIVAMGAMGMLRRSIRRRSGMDIHELKPENVVGNCFVPALFAHGEGDDFVKIHHTEKLHEAYAGDKNFIQFAGDHNSPRPRFVLDSVSFFFINTLNPPNPEDDYFRGNKLSRSSHNSLLSSSSNQINLEKLFEMGSASEEDSDDDELRIALQLSLETSLEGKEDGPSPADRDSMPASVLQSST